MTTPASQLSHPKYRPDIDGLRAIAVLAVVVFHAFPFWLKGGFIGVDVFFVISGFLISTIIFESLDKGTFSFSEFYIRRVRRIFPALIVTLIACLAFGWFVLLADELNQLGKHAAAGAGFVSNLVFWGEAGYFDNASETKPLMHLWSLGIEEQFYIVWPLLLWFAWKRKLNLLTITAVVVIVSFLLNFLYVKQDPVATFYSPLTRFWELACGAVLAWFTLYKDSALLRTKAETFLLSLVYVDKRAGDGKILANVLSVTGLFLLGFGFLFITKAKSFPGLWAIVPVIGAVLIICAGQAAWLNRKLLSNRIAVWFGLISFPLYLWHWPILSFGRILFNDTPPRTFRILAVLSSVLLAWLTVKLVERPFRFGSAKVKLKVTLLCGALFAVGAFGLVVSATDFSKSHTYANIPLKRKGFEHAFEYSLAWYEGKDDWLFLGNSTDNTVAKLKLGGPPPAPQLDATVSAFKQVAEAAARYGTKVVFVMGPNKSSIYPEYLPEGLVPAEKKYSSYFLDELRQIPNLTVYDPTDDLLRAKNSEGLLYWKTDTHWNYKGAYLTYAGFLRLFNIPVPEVEFRPGEAHSGDLIEISKLTNFRLHPEDNWHMTWKQQPVWTEQETPGEQKTVFGPSSVVTSMNPVTDKYIWVVGDSFGGSLRPFFNATFKDIRYVGHWGQKLASIPAELAQAERKPDMVVIVRVERSF